MFRKSYSPRGASKAPYQLSKQGRKPAAVRWSHSMRQTHFFSGLPELADEALAVDIATQNYCLSRARNDQIRQISNNPYLDEYFGRDRNASDGGD